MTERGPQGETEQHQREEQMDRQVEMAHGGTVYQSAGDHDPAHKGLGNEEHPHDKINAKILEGDLFCEEEVENRDGIDQTRKAGEEAMEPLDIEDIFIFLQCHVE